MTGEFDYIVVGAGSAGCAVAARLAEDTAVRVLLIEAGPRDRNPWIHIPAGYYRTIRSGRLVREFETEPESELHDRVIRWPRGRVLGGSGAVNGLVYVRGQPADFDEWEALGNPGWGWKDVLPHFRRSERQERGEDEFHGGSGPIRVSDIRDRRKICDAFIEAGKSLGLTERTDFNRGHDDGVGYYQLTTGNGLRSTPAAYLRQRGRGRPKVRTGETVRKILIDGDRAIGVLARTGARTDMEYRAQREVVLCCGTVASPQVLQCSGIGPVAVLSEAGVDVVHPLAGVGSNLVDRLQIRTVFRCREPITINDVYNSPVRRALAGAQFALFRTGPLTIGAGQAAAFLRTNASLRRPDLELTFVAFSTPGPGWMPHAFPGFTILGYPLHPRSRGTIRIVSSDPSVPPRISPKYLTDHHDREMLLRALQLCRQFAEPPPFANPLSHPSTPRRGRPAGRATRAVLPRIHHAPRRRSRHTPCLSRCGRSRTTTPFREDRNVIARAMHWDRETLEEHERMGFHEGWGKAVDQLEALARWLPSIETEPTPSPPAPAPRVRTCLRFEDQALPAAEFYCTLLPESRIERVRYNPEVQGMGEPGSVLVVDFTLRGTSYMALNGGPHFSLDEAVSISVPTEDQSETDRLWEALIADGGTESRCGWLKDRFGLSWQITPKRAVELLNGPMAARVWPALFQMRKIDIAALEAAAGLHAPSATTASR